MSKNIRFVVRQARCVSTSVARAVNNDLRFQRDLLETDDKTSTRLPIELSEPKVEVDGLTTTVSFRYEGGTLVRVRLVDRNELLEHWRQGSEDWAVYEASAEFYHLDGSYQRVSDVKLTHDFDHEDLARLHDSQMGWYHPHVEAKTAFKGSIGIFFNNAANDGHLIEDPDTTNDGHYTMYDSVEYSVLVSGDKDRARHEAGQKLKGYYV